MENLVVNVAWIVLIVLIVALCVLTITGTAFLLAAMYEDYMENKEDAQND